jgi:hypothetical protein
MWMSRKVWMNAAAMKVLDNTNDIDTKMITTCRKLPCGMSRIDAGLVDILIL